MFTKKILCLLMALLVLTGCAAAQTGTDTSVPTTESRHVHVFEEAVTEPSCLTGGYTVFTCACGESYTDDRTPATGHIYTEKVVAPTWEEDGYTEHVCVCGESYRDTVVECEMYSTQPLSVSKQVLHFFDDAAFIGDSTMCKLQRFHMEHGTFGEAKFFATISYAVRHAADKTMFLTYRGRQVTPEVALEACGAKKAFILLGMNDIGVVTNEQAMGYWTTMVSNIREKCPDITIYIMSVTPVYTPAQNERMTNEKVNLYNKYLQTFAAENDCHYIDVATPMKDETGGMKEEFCFDYYVHMNQAACEVWAQALKDYVMQ